jgi:hypothetical protein
MKSDLIFSVFFFLVGFLIGFLLGFKILIPFFVGILLGLIINKKEDFGKKGDVIIRKSRLSKSVPQKLAKSVKEVKE